MRDVEKVDLNVLCEESGGCGEKAEYKEKLKAYYEASKANLETELAIYDHSPRFKRDYTLVNIYVPPGTNVVAFGNDACDRYGVDNYYYVKFYNFDKRVIQQREVIASCERNNFMLLVPPNTFYMDYWIGDNAVHNFNFGPRCTFCHRRRRYGRYKTASSSFFSSASSPAPSDTSSSSYSEDSFDDYGCN